MTRATIVKEEVVERGIRFLAIYLETKNSALVLLSEAEDQLGTLAASVPPSTEIRVPPLLSSVLLGDRHTITARMLAERLATKAGKIGLVSVYLKTMGETEANPILVRLFEKVVKEAKATEEVKGEGIST